MTGRVRTQDPGAIVAATVTVALPARSCVTSQSSTTRTTTTNELSAIARLVGERAHDLRGFVHIVQLAVVKFADGDPPPPEIVAELRDRADEAAMALEELVAAVQAHRGDSDC